MDKSEAAIDIFNRYAVEYQTKFMDVSLYQEMLDELCNFIKMPHADVLEVACGPGNISKYLLSKKSDITLLGTDLAPKMIDLAKKNNPSAEFKIMDGRQISNLKKKFDVIISSFFFPYLSKEELIIWIKDASQLLKEGGLLYISTMEDDYKNSGPKKGSSGEYMYMHYHEANYMLETLRENNFEILKLKRMNVASSAGTEDVDLIALARKKKLEF